MYQIVYDWFSENIFNSVDLADLSYTIGSSTLNGNEWLCHTGTIVVLSLLVFACGLAVVAIFKFFSGLVYRVGE